MRTPRPSARAARRPLLAVLGCLVLAPPAAAQAPFTLEQIKSYPYPQGLTAAATGQRVAWTFNEQGQRNIWVAEGPAWEARRLTAYEEDDGQELTSISVSADGRWVVYVRGGEHGSNWDEEEPVNPTSSPMPTRVALWAVPFEGGEPRLLAEDGDYPEISPRGDVVAFLKNGQVWTGPIDGSSPARRLFHARGQSEDLRWSPDGSRLAFVSDRGGHSFIGVFADSASPILWIEPSTQRDVSPRWSPDGRRLAFIRRPGAGGAPEPLLEQRHSPWGIWVADAGTGEASRLWQAPETLRGSVPTTHGGTNLHWAAGGRIAFLSYVDGWPHLYSIAETGGEPLLLTPGEYMAEHIRLSPDGRFLVFAGNAGPEADDIDRRHIVRVPVDRAAPQVLTPGTGIEWSPVVTGDGEEIVFISATPRRPPLPAVMPASGGEAELIAADRIPADFPADELVTPRRVTFEAEDGVTVRGQLFVPEGGGGGRPAVVYVHGGPPRQMLLGWHYSDYYANAYALNQYLAALGYVVLAVNYRLGIGYGYEFHRPPHAGTAGAAEYKDIRAAGHFLRSLPEVDDERVGIYGGSYGGYLTAMALGRDSELFAAGVDIHGVHDRSGRFRDMRRSFEPNDFDEAARVAWESSPVAYVSTWRSPVLLIHADDDRNVRFSETVDLARRLESAGVPFEELVIPDDTHHFLVHRNQLRVNAATADFLERKLRGEARAAGAN